MANTGIFNAAQYLALYPALVEHGYNEDNAWSHYVNWGAAELRAPNDELAGKVYAGSVLAYANGNPELAEYFGIEVPATELTAAQNADLVLHYVQYGYAEDRNDKLVDAPIETVTDLGELVEALEALQAAQAEQDEVIETVAEELGLVADVNNPAAFEDDVAGKVTETEEAIQNGGDNAAIRIDNFAAASEKAQQNLINTKEAELKAAVDFNQAAVNAVSPVLPGRVAQVEAAKTAFDTAAQAVAATNNKAEQVAIDVVNVNGLDAGLVYTAAIVADGGAKFGTSIELGEDGKLTDAAKDEIKALTVDGVIVDADTAKAIEAALTAALKANAAAVKNVNTAAGKLVTAIDAVNALDDSKEDAFYPSQTVADLVDPSLLENSNETLTPAADIQANDDSVIADLATAIANLEQFQKLVANYADAQEYLVAVQDAIEQVEDATVVLEDLGYVVAEVAEIDGELIATGTEDADVFVFNEGKALTVEFFAEQGDDVLYIGTASNGAEFVLKEIASDIDFKTSREGDVDVMEIFAQQQGTDVVLYVENQTFAGNEKSLADITTVTLTGVNLEDLAFDGLFFTQA